MECNEESVQAVQGQECERKERHRNPMSLHVTSKLICLQNHVSGIDNDNDGRDGQENDFSSAPITG